MPETAVQEDVCGSLSELFYIKSLALWMITRNGLAGESMSLRAGVEILKDSHHYECVLCIFLFVIGDVSSQLLLQLPVRCCVISTINNFKFPQVSSH